MDILKLLQEHGPDLYPEDLDFFETELATGDEHPAAYRAECLALIKSLRSWNSQPQTADAPAAEPAPVKRTGGGVMMNLCDLIRGQGSTVVTNAEQMLLHGMESMRRTGSYKSSFKACVARHPEIDADFLEKHFSFFQPWELGAILSVRQLPETFLEKYFEALDHDKIARYQKFSESFFMRHFSQMDADIVLKHGKNPWSKKENRSKQLDVFLRLKGIHTN